MRDFTHIFEGVDDPRRSNATRHDLTDMLMIALLGMICGAENCSDMARFGRAREDLLRKFLSLKHGIPSHDAFSDLFAILDPAGVNRALSRLAGDWADTLEGTVAAIDGKTLRRSFSDAAARSPLHLVQAFAVGAKQVLGQVRVDARSNEITAIPALPDLLDIEGATATADAMHTRRSTSEAIIARGGDHVPALKGNQETLNDDVRLFMEDPGMAEHIDESREMVEKDHGRIETRKARVRTDVGWLQEALEHDWPGLAAIGSVEARREIRGRLERETRYFIMSGAMTPERFMSAVRAHWGIENSLHWVLDVTMNEDGRRNRVGRGAENLAMLRRMTLNLARKMPEERKTSMRSKLKRASWDDRILMKVIGAANKIGNAAKMQ